MPLTIVVKFDESKHLPPDNPHQPKDIFSEFCEKADAIENPYEQAFFAMVFILHIQPFGEAQLLGQCLHGGVPKVCGSLWRSCVAHQ